MIVRKYRERKRGAGIFLAKEKNKKDLMSEFQTELGRRSWYQYGTRYEGGGTEWGSNA
jgi:hypothetical protein